MAVLNRILVVNAGSSSLKLRVLDAADSVAASADLPAPRGAADIAAVKDAIGEWHDWEELAAVAADVIGQGPQSKLVKQLKEITDERFRRALSISNSTRKNLRHMMPVNAVRA